MSANPEIPQDDRVTVEIDGVAYKARKGAMIIEVTDAEGITVPRFCYHRKLSVAANCRMCLVQVEKAPKPLPACATPVTDGMKVFTQSQYARDAQRSVMEFLLINHPLDCPICDQGGECELQDVALGYGRSISRFTEKKRVVKDKNMGPLIATDMTRCIHCTRCVRFLNEIAGYKELGGTGRGENLEIGTYIERSITSEMSGNIIDVCPVGALTSKPFRFTARAWELTQHPGIAPHDAVGSNLYYHTLGGKVMRAVPRDNESINEVWLSDRDRFGYQGLNSADRLQVPMVRRDGNLVATDWETALAAAVLGLRGVIDAQGPDQLGILVAPTATVEEMALLNRLANGIGCANIDHRLRQCDFSDDEHAPPFPWLGQSIAELEQLQAVLLVGSNIRCEQPIIAHRLRKAALHGAAISCINPVAYPVRIPLRRQFISKPSQMAADLAAIAACLVETTNALPPVLQRLVGDARPTDAHREVADTLRTSEHGTVLLGSIAFAHPQFAVLRALAAVIAARSGAILGYLPEAAGSVGGWLAGVLPHRDAGAAPRASAGWNAQAMLASPRHAYLLYGVEPEFDCHDPQTATVALDNAEFVLSLSAFAGGSAQRFADVVLPIACAAESGGTYINMEGIWQSFAAAAKPLGDSRPAWKVLRVLGEGLGVHGIDVAGVEQVRDALHAQVSAVRADNRYGGDPALAEIASAGLERVGDVAIYSVDALVRRATALQNTIDGQPPVVRVCAEDAERLGLVGMRQVRVIQDDAAVMLPLEIDARVPAGGAWIPAGHAETASLGAAFGQVQLEPAS